MSLTSQVYRRPMREEDMPFLLLVYASVRAEELSVVPWTLEQKAAFLQMQFMAQHTDYNRNYPNAAFDVIMLGDEPIGRISVDQDAEELRLLDIALLPQWRGHGIGSHLIDGLLADAKAAGQTIVLYVEGNNPAQRLYKRLGFQYDSDNGPYQRLTWRAETARQANTAS
jgi:ribosomal protein S18 acetylase RimI-like enzyme